MNFGKSDLVLKRGLATQDQPSRFSFLYAVRRPEVSALQVSLGAVLVCWPSGGSWAAPDSPQPPGELYLLLVFFRVSPLATYPFPGCKVCQWRWCVFVKVAKSIWPLWYLCGPDVSILQIDRLRFSMIDVIWEVWDLTMLSGWPKQGCPLCLWAEISLAWAVEDSLNQANFVWRLVWLASWDLSGLPIISDLVSSWAKWEYLFSQSTRITRIFS